MGKIRGEFKVVVQKTGGAGGEIRISEIYLNEIERKCGRKKKLEVNHRTKILKICEKY